MDLSKVEKLYSDNLEQFGIDAKAVGWGDHEKQYLRFKKLVSHIDYNEKEISINELGCGYGELVKFLIQESVNLKTYFGYDISQKMLDYAEKYLSEINSVEKTFYKASEINTLADYTIASGIFNVKFDHLKETWETYIEDTIKQMFEYSKKGISFNFLTKYVDWEAKDLYYADPLYYFKFCKENLSKKVNLIHDYNLYEFTIQVVK